MAAEEGVQRCELSGRMPGDLCVIAVFKIALYAPCLLSQISYRGVVWIFFFLCHDCECTYGGKITRRTWSVSEVFFSATRGKV